MEISAGANETVLQHILNNDSSEVYQTIIDEIRTMADWSIAVKCAVHTLQLGVRKSQREPNTAALLDLCQAVAKEIRKSKYVNYLRRNDIDFIIPHLDCVTRWGSTYILVNRYIK